MNLKYEELSTLSKKDIKEKIKKWDTEKWLGDLENKSSTTIYRLFKKEIKDSKCYDNRESSNLLFAARSNTLKLNIDKRHKNEDTKCDLCGYEKENLVHFLIECKELENARNKELIKKFHDENHEIMAGRILFENNEIETTKAMLESLWICRKIKRRK